MVIFLGVFNENTNNEEAIAIVINADSDSAGFPRESISIIDINEPEKPNNYNKQC